MTSGAGDCEEMWHDLIKEIGTKDSWAGSARVFKAVGVLAIRRGNDIVGGRA